MSRFCRANGVCAGNINIIREENRAHVVEYRYRLGRSVWRRRRGRDTLACTEYITGLKEMPQKLADINLRTRNGYDAHMCMSELRVRSQQRLGQYSQRCHVPIHS